MNRLRLLSLRNEEVVEFRNLAMIPCREHEIMDSAFTTYEKRLKEKASVMGGQNFVESGSIFALHFLHSAFLYSAFLSSIV